MEEKEWCDLSITALPTENNLNLGFNLNDKSPHFAMLWIKNHEDRSQYWSENVTRQHEAPIGGPKVNFPPFIYMGTTANEFGSALTIPFLNNRLIKTSTSVPPTSSQV